MPFRDPQSHLEDVLDAIEKIEGFIGNIDLAAYRANVIPTIVSMTA